MTLAPAAITPAAIAAAVAIIGGLGALLLARRPATSPFAFPVWVLVLVGVALLEPSAFGAWFGLDLRVLLVPLLQIITFGMGTTLSPADFTRVLRVPWPVAIGFALQFTVMPLAGWALASGFRFEPDVAAGLILVGCVAGGVASNVVTFLAGGDVALSVTMTACSTLASPFITPAWMKLLAGRLVPIDAAAMMLEILNMILVPVVAGLAGHWILKGSHPLLRRPAGLATLAALAFATAAAVLLLTAPGTSGAAVLRPGALLGASLLGLLALARLVFSHLLHQPDTWSERALAWLSMAGICLILGIITARSRDKLLAVGPLLVVAAALHNTLGYTLGYILARLARLDERTARTVAIEVGMQNSGMAAGLALGTLHSPGATLAPAIFGPWMNISGALLATWWKRRPPSPPTTPAQATQPDHGQLSR